jgi:hypothetical protein
MPAVMPVVAMDVGRGRREGAERRRTAPPDLGGALVPDMALPGRDAVFSREIPGGVLEAG